MNRNLRIPALLVVIFLGVVAAFALTGSDDSPSTASTPASAPSVSSSASAQAQAVRPDARRLGAPGRSGVTFTEFLDFECEACAAAFPVIEQLRREYAGRVTFAMRYFPVPSHRNAENAAVAVEAAAQQGRLEEMYKRMYETQTEWSEQTASMSGTFRRFAVDLGLDMRAFDAAVESPRTLARVRADRKEGIALGVEGTPTFFIDEERISPRSVDELRSQLDAAVRAA